jgi:uncharacterized protein
MALTFDPIAGENTLLKQKDYRAVLATCPQVTSDYSFLNLWGWAEVYGLEWAWEKGLVWIRQTLPEKKYWAPMGPWQEVDWGAARKALTSDGTPFIRVPEALCDIWRVQNLTVSVEEARGHWDYLYSTRELTELKGNRFHKKKNLFNQFLKKYDHLYVPFGPELVPQALSLQTDWCEWRDCESFDTLAAENNVIEKTFAHWEALDGLLGGGIKVDGRLVAYTVAEPISTDTVVIHFEKGNPDIIGAYQAINQMFLASLPEGLGQVNREQDLDDPGLRKAKLSYHPSGFLKKFTVVI